MSDELFEQVYAELKRIAHGLMARERPGHTLQTTELVHETYLRLFVNQSRDWQRDAYFFAAAARAMRQILTERARRVATAKRGHQWHRLTLQESLIGEELDPARTLDLDAALDQLEQANERVFAVVMLRLYAGLTVKEASTVLSANGRKASERTVKRDWLFGRARLRRALTSYGNEAPASPI